MAIQTKTIDYADGNTGLEGYFAWDNATTGPRPGVLIVHAWAGRSPFEEEVAAWQWMFMVRACLVITLRKTPS